MKSWPEGIRTTARSALLASGLAIGVGLVACYPDSISNTAESTLVVTENTDGVDYHANRTYAINQTVVDLADTLGISNPIDITPETSAAIIAAVKRNMSAYSYQEIVPDTAAGVLPDVAVLVGAVASNNWVIFRWWWPCYWPGCFGWGWGGGTSASNFPIGSIVMVMGDVASRDEGAQDIPIIWVGGINGLLSSSSGTEVGRINSTIDQAFEQSPYLELGPTPTTRNSGTGE
jgi:Domain of unknown function (DUF4136)